MALIANVVTGGTIAATWGNAVRDATVQVTTSAARPTSPAQGMVIYETDTNRLLAYNGTAWVRVLNATTANRTGFTARLTTTTSVATGAYATVSLDTKDYDSDTFLTVPTGTATIPTGLDGIYAISASATFATGKESCQAQIVLTTGGSTYAYSGSVVAANFQYGGPPYTVGTAVTMPLAAGDSMIFTVGQSQGAAINMSSYRVTCYRIGI